MTLPDPESPSCLIMQLPEEMLIPAARNAVEIFPANAPQMMAAGILPPQLTAAITTKYWGSKPRQLSVEMLDGANAAVIRRILEHMNAWDCGITFAHTNGQGEVRITRAGNNYASYLGTDVLLVPAGQPTMWLGGFTERSSEALYRRVVRHETGHALSFPHEHLRRVFVDRIDRAKAYAYFARWQGWPPEVVDANVLTPVEEVSLLRPTRANATSIMTYPLPGDIMIDGLDVPGGEDLTEDDLAYADSVYPLARPTPPVTPPLPVEPEPPKPPEPVVAEEFGPFDLEMGRPSDTFTLLPGTSVLFRFKARARAVYIATTAGKQPLVMALLDAEKKTIKADEMHEGLGPNALVAASLKRGTHYLRVTGAHPDVRGPFRVKVARSDP